MGLAWEEGRREGGRRDGSGGGARYVLDGILAGAAGCGGVALGVLVGRGGGIGIGVGYGSFRVKEGCSTVVRPRPTEERGVEL